MLQEIVKFFINPVLQVFVVFFILFQKRLFQKDIIYFISFLYLTSIPITGIIFQNFWKVSDSYKNNIIYDAAVILAGGVDHRWYVKDNQEDFIINEDKYFIFNSAAERFFTGIEFVKSGKIKKIYYGNYVTESLKGPFDTSLIVKRFAMKNGIAENQFVIYGEKVKNTLDEAKHFSHIKNKSFNDNILLITSQSHMRRASSLFKKQGMEVDTYSVQKRIPLKTDIINMKNYIPSIRGFNSTKNGYYEFFGFLGYFIMGKL